MILWEFTAQKYSKSGVCVYLPPICNYFDFFSFPLNEDVLVGMH